LKDGDLSPQDMLLGMELGFQTSELDKLNSLIKYKIKQVDSEKQDEESESELLITPEIPELKQDPLERDDAYEQRVSKYNASIQKTKDFALNALQIVPFDFFDSPKKLKADSEQEFKKYLVNYINT
jgi:hypothetical protein